MKRIIHFAQALLEEFKGATSAEIKKALLEDAKIVIGLTMTGPWALLATHVINDLEKTIKS